MKETIKSVEDLYQVLEKRESWINPSLDNITSACKKLGDPQNKYKVIQIAGTNGKTSTSTYLSYILRSEGMKVGRYTSPHLESFTERISVNGVKIGERELVDLVKNVYEEKLSGFEILTAAAFKYFAEQEVDIAVMEVGMGGRWDATSVANSFLVALTNIDLDHTEILGDSKEKIALEKVAAVKSGSVLVTTETDPGIREVFRDHCRRSNSRLLLTGEEFYFDELNHRLVTANGLYEGFEKLQTVWQPSNVSLAIVAAEQVIGSAVCESTASRIIEEQSEVSGRFEQLASDPRIIIDGAHNPAAAEKLAQTLKSNYVDENIILILGILADKDIQGIIDFLVPVASKVILSENKNARSAAADELLPFVQKFGKPVTLTGSLEEAIDLAVAECLDRDLICVSGSLYTVGAARSIIRKMVNNGAIIGATTT